MKQNDLVKTHLQKEDFIGPSGTCMALTLMDFVEKKCHIEYRTRFKKQDDHLEKLRVFQQQLNTRFHDAIGKDIPT